MWVDNRPRVLAVAGYTEPIPWSVKAEIIGQAHVLQRNGRTPHRVVVGQLAYNRLVRDIELMMLSQYQFSMQLTSGFRAQFPGAVAMLHGLPIYRDRDWVGVRVEAEDWQGFGQGQSRGPLTSSMIRQIDRKMQHAALRHQRAIR